MPLGFPPGGIRSGLTYVPSAGDVFVVSYPKCGTTWLQYIVYLLVRGRPLAPDESLTERFPHLEEVGAAAVADMERPRLIKTHLGRPATPFGTAAKYLVIARNPFDCAVSFYHHTRGFPRHYAFADGSFDDFFECFLAGEVDFGDYFDHLLSWEAAAGQDNVFELTYEALRADPPGLIRRIAAFLGPEAAERVSTEAGLAGVIRETSLESMQQDQQRWSSQRPDWAAPFVREGAVGGWRSWFSPDQTRSLLAKFDERLGGTRLAGLWPDVIATARAWAGRRDQKRTS